MKTKITILLAVILSLTSCCHKEDCLAGNFDAIYFNSFVSSDIDSITIRRFSTTSHFTTPIDTIFLIATNSAQFPRGDTTKFYITDTAFKLSTGFNYEIYIPATRTVSQISNITDIRTSQKICLVCDCVRNPCLNPISSYKLNGQVQATPYLYIK